MITSVGKLVRKIFSDWEPSSQLTNLAPSTVGTVVVKVGGVALVFLTSLVLAQLLGASKYGPYAYAVSWAILLSVPAGLGLDVLLIREVARNSSRKDLTAVHAVLRWSRHAVLVTSIVIVLIAAVGLWFLNEKLEPGTGAALWTALLILPPLALVRLHQGGIQGLGRVISAQVPQLLLIPASLVALVGALSLAGNLTAPMAVAAYAAAAILACLYSGSLLRVYIGNVKNNSVRSTHVRNWLRSALPLFIVTTAGTLNDLISVVLLGALSSSQLAGVFDVARKIAILVSFGLMAVSLPLAPTIATLHANGDRSRLQGLVNRSTQVALLMALPVTVGLIVFGKWILSLFGPPFMAAHLALTILCLGHLVNAYIGYAPIMLNMSSHEGDVARSVIVAALLNALLGFSLIPTWGIEGAAVANTVSVITFLVLLGLRVRQKLGVHPAFFVVRKTDATDSLRTRQRNTPG